MKVSIVTVCFNSEITIVDTLESIRMQSHSDIEYIVIDGNSEDRTNEIVNNYSDIVSIHISEKDNGLYDAMNKGISVATGDIVGFLHSDDVFASMESVSNLVKAFEDSSGAIYADLIYVKKANLNKVVRMWKSGPFTLSKLKSGWMPPHPTFYMRTELYKKFGVFNLDYKIAADYDSLLRYLWVNKVKLSYLPEVLIKMRVGGESNRSLRNIYYKSLEDIKIMKSNGLPFLKTFLIKNISKIPQFIFKE